MNRRMFLALVPAPLLVRLVPCEKCGHRHLKAGDCGVHVWPGERPNDMGRMLCCCPGNSEGPVTWSREYYPRRLVESIFDRNAFFERYMKTIGR